jgi:hypothetical protein
MSRLHCLAFLLAATQAAAQDAPQPRVLAAWSQVVGTTDPAAAAGLVAPSVELRLVLEAGADCGAFGIDFRASAGGPWQAAGAAPTARVATPPPLAVTVCTLPMRSDGRDWFEARLTWGAATAVLASELVAGDTAATVGQGFAPGPSDGAPVVVKGGAAIGARGARRLVVAALGDTGCRGVPAGWEKPQLTEGDRERLQRMTQPCDPQNWPLAELAAAAAAQAPDLVIHVGDYRYFLEDEVPHPAAGWLYWQKDFFPAAQPLLLAAPLVPARGNHEACGDWGFGDGYFQLFGPGEVTSCAGASDPMPPHAFDVAPGGLEAGATAAHRFVILDTNEDTTGDLTAAYRAAMALTRAPDAPASAWWVTHVPAIVLVDYGDPGPPIEHTGDPELQADLIAAAPGRDLSGWFCGEGGCRPSQILLGHQHLYQSLRFFAPGAAAGPWVLPRHVVVGHGGTPIDLASPAPSGAVACRYDGFTALAAPGRPAPVALAETQTLHGLVVWTRSAETLGEPSGWTEQPLWAGGQPLAADGAPPMCDN